MQSNKPNQGVGDEPIQGELPDAADVYYTAIGEDLFKRSIPFANEVLRQLLTLSVALLSGSIFFLAEAACPHGLRLGAMVLFFLGMLAAFVGVLPYRDSVCLHEPAAIRDNVRRAIAWKDGLIWAASVFIGLGLTAAFIGVLVK